MRLVNTLKNLVAKDKDFSTRITSLEDKHIYSTSEKRIGTWVDGKPIYRKVISVGALPNNTDKSVAHGISNLKRIIDMRGYAYNPSASAHIPINNPTYNSNASNINVVANNIDITTHTNRTSFSEAYVVLIYTKTTD